MLFVLIIGLAALSIAALNSYQLSGMNHMQEETDRDTTTSTGTGAATMSGPDVIPEGTPERYGEELDVSYDDIDPNDQRRANEAINDLAQIDRNTELEGEDLDRYVEVLYHEHDGMSCEYCCGARSIIFENGEPACGCAHSFAMRGLAKYLILEHGDEMSNEEIIEEVGKWKVLFFPTQHEEKAQALEEEGIEISYQNLTTNQYRGIEEGSQGGMVGGC